MSTALATTDEQQLAHAQIEHQHELSVQALVDRKRKIVKVMEAVMREGEHYGRIPGCGDKPTLLKAGAEVLATTFGLAPTFKITKIDLPGGHREYEIVCTLQTIGTGTVIGEGVGSCSTMESKYRWRGGSGRKCPECGKPAIMKSKFDDGGWYCYDKKGGCGAKFNINEPAITSQSLERTEHPDIADTYNTVLKMAKKRAQVDCTLTAVGASDLLTQDLEDLPAGSRGEERPPYVRDDVQDAEFADIARSHGQKGDHVEGSDAFLAEADRRKELDKKAREDDLNASVRELIAELEAAKTPDAVQLFAKACNAVPKGTRARTAVMDCYHKRLEAVTPKKDEPKSSSSSTKPPPVA